MGFINDLKEKLKNEAKNKAKKEIKKVVFKILRVIAPYLLILIVAVLAIAMIFAIFNSVTEKLAGLSGQTTTYSTIQKITDDGWIDLSKKYDADGDPSTEDQTLIEYYISELQKLGISLKELRILGEANYDDPNLLQDPKNKAQMEKYIHAFVEADLITSQIHRRNENALTVVDGSNSSLSQADQQMLANKIDGGIYLYRTKGIMEATANTEYDLYNDKMYERMEYKTQNEFNNKISQFNSISGKDDNFIGKSDIEAIEKIFSIDDEGNLLIAQVDGYTKTRQEEDEDEEIVETIYKAQIKTIEYKSKVAEFALPYEFLVDLCMITQNPEYVFHVAQMSLNTKIDILLINNETTKITVKEKEEKGEHGDGTTYTYTVTTTTTEKSTNPNLELRYANSWAKYQKNIWTDRVDVTTTHSGGSSSSTTKTKITNNYSCIEGSIIRKSDNFLGLLRNKSGQYLEGTTPLFNIDGCKFDRYGINVVYKIPNYTTYEDPLSKLMSGEEMLYELLRKNERTQSIIELMRYYMSYPEQEYYELEENEIEEILGGYGEEEENYIGTDYIVKTDEPGALKPVTKDQLINIINATFSGAQRTNAISIADTLIECQNKYKVNAVFVLAFARQETSVGTANTNYVKKDNNWLSWNLGRKFSSPQQNVETVMSKMATGSIYFTKGKITIAEIGHTYCPNEPKHPTQGDNWVEKVTGYVKNMYSKIGFKVEDTVNEQTNNKIVKQAAECMKYLVDNGFTYKYGGTPSYSLYGKKNSHVDCSGYVSWVLYELGYLDGRWTSETFSNNPKNWKKITDKESIKAGDIVVYEGHVEICAEDVTDVSKIVKYNAGSTAGMKKSPYGSGWHSRFKCALRILE